MKNDMILNMNHAFDFSEGEVYLQKSLLEAYENKGYSVVNYHEIDRPHEEAGDLICEKNNKSISIQTKIKPRKKDIPQLEDLSNRNEDKKIYIYFEEPVKNFKKAIENTEDVEFWDRKKTHDFLIENDSSIYVRLYFASLPIFKNLAKIYLLIIENRNLEVPSNFNRHSRQLLWSVKDDMVKSRSISKFLHEKYVPSIKEKINFQEDEKKLLNTIIDDLSKLNDISIKKSLSTFEQISHQRPDLLKLYWEKASERTGWKKLCHKVSQNEEDISNMIMLKWLIPLHEDDIIGNEGLLSISNTTLSTVCMILKNLKDRTKDLEDGIDWTWSDLNTYQS